MSVAGGQMIRREASCQGCGATLCLDGSTEQLVTAFIDIHADCEKEQA